MNRKDAAFLPGDITCATQKQEKDKLSVTSIPNDRLFTALNSSAVAAPVLPVQVPVAGVRAGHVRAPAPRRNHSYPLCADGTLQTVRSRKAGRQARETLTLAQSQQKVSRCLKDNTVSQRPKKQAEQQSKFPTHAYKF